MKQVFLTSFRYLKEDFVNNFLPLLFSLGIIAFSLFVVALFLFIKGNLDIAATSFKGKLEARIFLSKEVKESQIKEIESRLRLLSAVKKFEYQDRDEVRRNFIRMFPTFAEVIENIGNPFPPTIKVYFSSEASKMEIDSALDELRSMEFVDDVVYEKEIADRIIAIVKLIKMGGFFLQLILLFSSLLIIANVIGLNIYSKKDEIYILQIVGASRPFISFPFVFEGVVMGLLGGVMALILFSISYVGMKLYTGESWKIIHGFLKKTFLSSQDALILLGAGVAVGFFASLISVEKYLISNR